MNVLVLGAGGMAGHLVSLYLREKGHNVDTVSATHALDESTRLIDVTDTSKLQQLLGADDYDIVVNCIGLLVKQSEERKDLAVYLNAYLPHVLEDRYKDSKTKIVHISTNGVFSGENPPYQENSPLNGTSFYGRSKALGELINDKDLTFRMSIIGPDMRPDGAGLFNWFYSQQCEINGYNNVMWSGVTTLELAKSIADAIEQNVTGLYQLVPKTSISKFDLLQLIKEVFDCKDVRVKPIAGSASDMTLVNTRKDFDHQIPDYKIMLYDMKTWIESHSKLYPHYEK